MKTLKLLLASIILVAQSQALSTSERNLLVGLGAGALVVAALNAKDVHVTTHQVKRHHSDGYYRDRHYKKDSHYRKIARENRRHERQIKRENRRHERQYSNACRDTHHYSHYDRKHNKHVRKHIRKHHQEAYAYNYRY